MAITISRSIACPLALFGIAFFISTTALAREQSSKDAPAALNAYMQARLKATGFSGAVLVARGGHILLARGYGSANLEWNIANSTSTKFRIGSLTKQFTATLIMQLREQHKLQVTDPICNYLSSCPPTWTSITVRELLSHTSGIPNFTDFPEFNHQVPRSVDQVIALFRDKPLEFEPGAGWKYSNSNYVLLGAIIERITSQTYEEVLREKILAPLKMSDTGYDHHQPILSRRASGYSFERGAEVNARYIDTSWGYAAGAMYSTVLDLYRWDRALYTESILPKAALKEMWTPVDNNYGYGWGITQSGETVKRLEVMHDGGIDGFSSHISRFPDEDEVVIVLANVDEPKDVAGATGVALAAILHGETYLAPLKTSTVQAFSFDRYLGDYDVEKMGVTRFARDGDKLHLKLMDVPRQPEFPAVPVSETTIICENLNGTIEFVAGVDSSEDKMLIEANGKRTHRIGRRVMTDAVVNK